MSETIRRKKALSAGAKAAPSKTRGAKTPATRADFGEPIDGFFEKQPLHLRVILEELRRMVREVAPDSEASLKWGMPWFTVNGNMMCSLGGHKAHVNLVLVGPADAFSDPGGRLSGSGPNGRHLRLETIDDLPRSAVRGWLKTAARLARQR